MTTLTLMYAAVVLGFSVFALIVLGRLTRIGKVALVVFTVSIYSMTYVAFMDFLGRPRPIELSGIAHFGERAEIIYFVQDQDYWYVWVMQEGQETPMSYSLEKSKDKNFSKMRARMFGEISEHLGKDKRGAVIRRDSESNEFVVHPTPHIEYPKKGE